MSKKWKKRVFVVLTFFAVIAAMFALLMKDQKAKGEKLYFEKIDMTQVQEGTYHGDASTGVVQVEVEVIVKNHTIISIDLIKHDNGLGAKAESMLEDMVNTNTNDVDTITGATVSSQTLKSAVCVALLKGIE